MQSLTTTNPWPGQIIVCFLRCLCACVTLGAAGAAEPKATPVPTAAVFYDAQLGGSDALAKILASQVKAAGYHTEWIDLAALTNRQRLTTNFYDLLAVPGGRDLPLESAATVEGFLKSGGDLLAVGMPLWQAPKIAVQNRWITREDYAAVIMAQRPQQMLVDFASGSLRQWERHSNTPQAPARHEIVTVDGTPCLHVVVEDLTNWDTFSAPAFTNPFPSNHILTCFRAKGGPQTRMLMVEWTETDGSRWIATVNLTREWQWYVLPPSAFQPWTPPAGRGGPNDSLNVRHAKRLTVGVAISHAASTGRHEYWISAPGTAPLPFGGSVPKTDYAVPQLESFAPAYHCFPVTTPVRVKPSHEKTALEDWETKAQALAFTPEFPLLAVHPRPRGVGFAQDRPWRWEPLLGAYDAASGDHRGALGVMVVHAKAPFRGSVWTGFTPSEPSFYTQPLVTHALRQALTRMREGIFLLEGGANQFTVFATGGGPPLTMGARMVNFGRTQVSELVPMILCDQQQVSGSRKAQLQTFSLAPGQEKVFTEPPALSGIPGLKPRQITALLHSASKTIDALSHDIALWDATQEPNPITIREGGFQLDGKTWKAHGINYMPSSGIAQKSDYFEHWLGRGAYDPSVIQRDLERIASMGLNSVSVFIYHRSIQAHHLLDFLRRCRALGLRVNLSLRPGTPMAFRWREMREIIEHYRLPENHTVFTYDLAWEPSHYDQSHQEREYTALWNIWVARCYGNVNAAATAWESTPPPDGKLTVPPMSQLTKDGPWRKQVADYRRFLDELLQEKYAEARRLVQSVDPGKPVSFRMQYSGDPTHTWPGLLPYDFLGLAKAVDIWEPEAYGRIGEWEQVKPGHFTASYARLCDPSKPVMWAEMGYSVWDMGSMAADPGKLAFAARYYRNFYRMLIESGADGIYFWWYPGGFRVNENSDYGIINPDGTDREITQVIRTEGRRFVEAPKSGKPDFWIAVDRDRDARGLPGIYEAVKKEYWEAIAAGKRPGLIWKDGMTNGH